MALPFAAMYAVSTLHRDRGEDGLSAKTAGLACGMMLLTALLLVAIVFSLSRMGFLCGLAALLVAGSLALSMRGWRPDYTVASAAWRRLLPVAAVALVASMGFIFLPTDPLIARFSDLAHTEDITADTRAQLWRDTGPLIADYPLFGCGLGAYESCFLKYKTVAPMNTANFAHNDYLQILAELGILAFAAGLAFVFGILFRTTRAVLYVRSLDERYRAIACVASMTAMLLHSLVDFNMYVPANAVVFACVAGIAAATLARRPRLPEGVLEHGILG
jgi:O-antigen ligase